MEMFYLYLFVMLSDIKAWLGGIDFAIFWVPFIVAFTGSGFASLLMQDDEDMKEFREGFLKVFNWCRTKGIMIAVAVYALGTLINFTATMLPSTGQAAAIYLGATAVKSDTAEVLSRLPAKYATLLEQKADEWVNQQVIKSVEMANEQVEEVIEQVKGE